MLAQGRRMTRADGHVAVPPPELLEQLRRGKAALHRRLATLPLPEKVRLVLELQQIVLPPIARQRPLRWWERAWEIDP